MFVLDKYTGNAHVKGCVCVCVCVSGMYRCVYESRHERMCEGSIRHIPVLRLVNDVILSFSHAGVVFRPSHCYKKRRVLVDH